MVVTVVWIWMHQWTNATVQVCIFGVCGCVDEDLIIIPRSEEILPIAFTELRSQMMTQKRVKKAKMSDFLLGCGDLTIRAFRFESGACH